MASSTTSATASPPAGHHYPAYGPIEAALGMYLFYVVVDRATPRVVGVLGDVLPALAASTVRLWLAMFIWFVVGVTLLDQVRRQLAALGVTTHPEVARAARHPGLLDGQRALGYGVMLLLGWLYVASTWDAALDTAVAVIPLVVNLDVAAVDVGALLVMVVFFVAYGLATRSLDRLLIGGVRYALAEG